MRRAVVATAVAVVVGAASWIASSRVRQAPGGGVAHDVPPAATPAAGGASPSRAGDATAPPGEEAVPARRADVAVAPVPLQVITRPSGGEPPSVAASPHADQAASLERRRAFWRGRFEAYQKALRAVRDDPTLDLATKAAETRRLHGEAFGEEARREAQALAAAPEGAPSPAPSADAAGERRSAGDRENAP